MLVYFSSETAQEWGSGRGKPGEDGGAFWLPGNAVVELRMVPPVSRGPAGDAQVLQDMPATFSTHCMQYY